MDSVLEAHDLSVEIGGRLTLSDIAFAVAAAPVVLPAGYGGPMPSFEEMPSEVQTVVTEMRSHPAGAFALRIYDQQRDRLGAGPDRTLPSIPAASPRLS